LSLLSSRPLLTLASLSQIVKERFNDPEADKALASAHRELSRLKTDVETLKYEKELGYTFEKNMEEEIIMLEENLLELKGKEKRKKDKLVKVKYERDAAREEYMAWVKRDYGREMGMAQKVLGNSKKILEKMDSLKKRALLEEKMDSLGRGRASTHIA